MTTPTNEPTAVARQRALVRTFRHATQQWADTQQQEGERYQSNAQEYTNELEQSNQNAQNQRSLILEDHQQVLIALSPVELDKKLQKQPETSFIPTVEDSEKLPVAELSASISTLTRLTRDIRRGVEILSEEREAIRRIREEQEVERLRIKRRNRNIAIAAVPILLALIYAGYRQYIRSMFQEIDGVTYVYISAGEFIMGSENGDSDESPRHTVYLDAYWIIWIMQTEVTNAQYGKFMDASGYTTESYWGSEGWAWRIENDITQPICWSDNDFNGSQQPVVCVSWYEAEAYANWLSEDIGLDFGLPTEAQWEKAARGTEGRIYPWGNQWDGSRVNYCDKNCTYDHADKGTNDGYQYTAPVGNYATGASPYGALDMVGNVWEWTADWYVDDYYQSSPDSNPQGPASGDRRVWRGGSWELNPNYVRAAVRNWGNPDYRYFNTGFRLWLSASPD